MKNKYYNLSTEILFIDIMTIINKYPDREQASKILESKLGFIDKQIGERRQSPECTFI